MATDMAIIMDDYWAAWNSHEVEKILSYFTDDVVYEDVAMGIVNRGKNEVKDFCNSIFIGFPDFKIELKSIFVSVDWAAQEWVLSGTFTNSVFGLPPATGKSASVRGISVEELRNGKISRNSNYYDMASFMQQVGLMPGP